MRSSLLVYRVLLTFIGLVWLVNGLYCKVLNGVPRHQAIVGEILGHEHARLLTVLIGVSEIVMALWIWSRFRARLNAIAQITVVGVMNLLEFILVPDMLLWGQLNAVFALGFMALVYVQAFYLTPRSHA